MKRQGKERMMARMTRTQVTLEEEEYRFLKSQAAEGGVSLSSLVRDLVRERMRRVAASAPHVWDVAGMISESDFTGSEHDDVLWGRQPGDAGGKTPGAGR